MANATPHTITDIERGHRAPLSPDEPTVIYPLRVPLSWRDALKKAGADAVRKRLKKLIGK